MFSTSTRLLAKLARGGLSRNVHVNFTSPLLTLNKCSRRNFLPSTQAAERKGWDSGFLTHADLAKRFEEFDHDEDGFVTVAACRAAMNQLELEVSDGLVGESIISSDLDDEEVIDYFEFMDHFLNAKSAETNGELPLVDLNPDGVELLLQFNSISELLNHCVVKPDSPNASSSARQARAELIQTFKRLDLDGDGRISSDELRVALRSMSSDVPASGIEASVAQIFNSADVNGDGFIDLYEFSARAVGQRLYV